MSPLTVPFMTMLVTSTLPSMKPLSLTDKRAAVVRGAAHVAVDASVQMQAAGKLEVAVERGGLAEKRIDARGCLLASTEH